MSSNFRVSAWNSFLSDSPGRQKRKLEIRSVGLRKRGWMLLLLLQMDDAELMQVAETGVMLASRLQVARKTEMHYGWNTHLVMYGLSAYYQQTSTDSLMI